jgi:hypothetical protein
MNAFKNELLRNRRHGSTSCEGTVPIGSSVLAGFHDLLTSSEKLPFERPQVRFSNQLSRGFTPIRSIQPFELAVNVYVSFLLTKAKAMMTSDARTITAKNFTVPSVTLLSCLRTPALAIQLVPWVLMVKTWRKARFT